MKRPGITSLVACCVAITTSVLAAPVGSALERPALSTRQAAHSVLLAAAQVGPRLVAVGERGIIVLSDDQGAHWRQAVSPVSVTLTAVVFADPLHGLAVGHGGTVLATQDRGEHWVVRLDGRELARQVVSGAQASGDAVQIKDALQLAADGPDKPLLDVDMPDPTHAVVVGAYGIALETKDGGVSWSSLMPRIQNPKALHLNVIRRLGDTWLLAGEQGLAFVSHDAGQSFRRLSIPYHGSLFTAEILGEGHFVVAGLRGNVWQSTDGGANWSQLASPVPVSIVGSARRGADIWLVNQAGQILTLRSGTLAIRGGAVLPPLNGILPLRDGRLLVVSLQGALVLSRAGGDPQ